MLPPPVSLVVCAACLLRSYEKRKQAALEIEHIVKELKEAQASQQQQAAAASSSPSKPAHDGIRLIIQTLTKEFANSTQSNQRKGGLIGLAATSIALMEETPLYLDSLLPPVLRCFSDQESRVRYYACEALYNISKVSRGAILLYFNELFDGLCKLYADSDIDVKNGAQLLDRLLKDLVTESEAFDVDKFIPLLKERIRIKNPFIRQLLVGWITVLDSVPDIDMLEFLPDYLGGLFDMLADPNKDIRQQAYAALAELLRELLQSPHVELQPMVAILVQHCDSRDNFTRLTVLSWLHEFISLDRGKLLPLVSDILGVTLHCLSDSEKEIRVKSDKANDALLRLVETNDSLQLNYPQLLLRLTAELSSKWVASRLAALRWINALLAKSPQHSLQHLNSFFPQVLKSLGDADDAVVRLALEVLARVSVREAEGEGGAAAGAGSDGGAVSLDAARFELVLSSVMSAFAGDRRFLEQRGSLVVRQLCELLDAESIYRAVARWLTQLTEREERRDNGAEGERDDGGSATANACEFASLMVQSMNLILLTSSELFELRGRLKRSLSSPAGRELFTTLYRAWSHNPVSTFSLCLLSQSYSLSSALISHIAELEMTVGALMQIDTLIQLIESPVFIALRLHLLEPRSHPLLVKAMYGLLMLLPQSSAFVSLQTRLQSIAPLTVIADRLQPALAARAAADSSAPVKGGGAADGLEEALDSSSLLDHFVLMQQKHARKRLNLFQQQSLLHRHRRRTADGGGGGEKASDPGR